MAMERGGYEAYRNMGPSALYAQATILVAEHPKIGDSHALTVSRGLEN
jgi:hypothetical protein